MNNQQRKSSLKIGLHCQCLNLKFLMTLKMICLPSCLLAFKEDQVFQHFMQSGVDLADKVAPLPSVENEEPSVSLPQIVCEENQDSASVPMTDGNPES